MDIAVSGTQFGMTDLQRDAARQLISGLKVRMMHNGWCIGADEDFLRIANDLAPQLERIYGYPSTIRSKVSDYYPDRVPVTLVTPQPPLERNRTMVQRGKDGLIATPKEAHEILRSGTWSTVRYARSPIMSRTVWIIQPDGAVVTLVPINQKEKTYGAGARQEGDVPPR